ncbi:MAG: hypothetical protein ACE37H_04225 [Phycisphaeraceae bacterium]
MIGLGLYIVFFLFMLVGLVVGVVLWSTGGRSRSGGEMACGSCGYAVRGLTQWACPECGADLREAGIRSGGSSGRRVLGVLLTIACSAVLLLSCVVPAVMFTLPSGPSSSSPVTYPNSSTGTAIPAAPNTNSTGESNDVDAEGSGEDSGGESDSTDR